MDQKRSATEEPATPDKLTLKYVLPPTHFPYEESLREINLDDIRERVIDDLPDEQIESIFSWLKKVLESDLQEPQKIYSHNPLWSLTGGYLHDLVEEIEEVIGRGPFEGDSSGLDYITGIRNAIDALERGHNPPIHPDILRLLTEVGYSEEPGYITDLSVALCALREEYNPDIHPDTFWLLTEIDSIYTSVIFAMIDPELRDKILPLPREELDSLIRKYSAEQGSYYVPYAAKPFILSFNFSDLPSLLDRWELSPIHQLKRLVATVRAPTTEEEAEYRKIC